MQRRSIAAVMLLAGLMLAGAPCAAQSTASPTLIVPADLYRYADSLGCDQVADFYDAREGVLRPPFVYVDEDVPWWDTASALWCRPRGAQTEMYTLLFRFGSKSGPIGRCPNRIDGQQHIGGLSVVKVTHTLDHFRYVDEPTKAGPAVQPSGVAIQSEYDGTGGIFCCHEGRWLHAFLH